LVVRSPGTLRQQRDVPPHFSLDDTLLEHLPRNALLIEWLKSIRDAKDGPYVRALQEGTRRMRDEMPPACPVERGTTADMPFSALLPTDCRQADGSSTRCASAS
jgi:hypothetical protein